MNSHIEKTRNAIPQRSSKRERYIGFRENLNGPSLTIMVVGFAGSNAVLFLIRTIKALPAKQPDTINSAPPIIIRIINVGAPGEKGNRYSSKNAIPRHRIKYRGGGSRTSAQSLVFLTMFISLCISIAILYSTLTLS